MIFKDKIVWITGASSGIGEALVYAFNNVEAKLIISARREDELIRVKNNCKKNSEIFILPLDLLAHQTYKDKVKQVIEKFEKIDILVNNAGIGQRGLVKDTDFEVIKQIMDINFLGTVALTKEVLPLMLNQKCGKIVVMSSLTGKFGAPLRSAYSASKHALHGFFDTLRAETIEDNIDILLVCAGYVKTNISLNALTANGKPQNKMDDGQNNGMMPEILANKILKAISRNKKELTVGGKEVLGVYIKRFFPNLFCKIIAKQK